MADPVHTGFEGIQWHATEYAQACNPITFSVHTHNTKPGSLIET